MTGHEKERILEYYFADKRSIHITCKDGRFYNGVILEINTKKKIIVFIDDKLGEIPLLFEDIFRIEPFKEESDGR